MTQALAGYADAKRLATMRKRDGEGVDHETLEAFAKATLGERFTHPPKARVRRWRDTFLSPLKRAEAGIFTVYAPTADLAARVAADADKAFEETARELLGRAPKRARAQIVVHVDRATYIAADEKPTGTPFASLTVPREKTSGITYRASDPRGKGLVRVETYATAPGVLEVVLPHEIVHVVQLNGFKAFRVAPWLDEGMAMLRESEGSRAARLQWLRRSTEVMSLAELVSLRSTPPDRAFLYYNQAYALTAFLRDLGTPEDWRAFLDRLVARDLERRFLAATIPNR
ncbi:MAG: gluzincin family metallopeptidase [Planctomycetota bacterium]|jgi:hypothetical protein